MNEIKCPKCGTVFQINESDYEFQSNLSINSIKSSKEFNEKKVTGSPYKAHIIH